MILPQTVEDLQFILREWEAIRGLSIRLSLEVAKGWGLERPGVYIAKQGKNGKVELEPKSHWRHERFETHAITPAEASLHNNNNRKGYPAVPGYYKEQKAKYRARKLAEAAAQSPRD